MSSIIHQTGSVRPLSLQEREQPQLYRELFPYTSICRTTFDEVLLAPRPAEQMRITDTTFRDGQQARPPYTVKQVAKMFDFLHRMGGKTGLITASEFFLYSAKDRKCIDVCRARGYRFPRVTSWIRANKEDLKLARDMEFDETGMLTSVSDYHIYLKLGKTRQQAMDMYLDLARQALEWGIIPRCHFEDVTRADIYGFCLPFAQKLMELSQQSGMPVKIRLCDTMGYGVPYPGAALPRSVQRIVRAFTDEAGVPGEWLEWHGHNDFHKVLVNGVTAWLNGCGAVNSTLFGFGERTGNTPLEALIIEYISLTGDDAAADTTILSEVAEFFEKELHYNIPYNYPFVGRDFNATSAGVHADGLAKNEEIYNIFDTKHLLGRPVPIIITDKTGRAGVAYWINVNLKLPEGKQICKKHPAVGKIYEAIVAIYDTGRTTRRNWPTSWPPTSSPVWRGTRTCGTSARMPAPAWTASRASTPSSSTSTSRIPRAASSARPSPTPPTVKSTRPCPSASTSRSANGSGCPCRPATCTSWTCTSPSSRASWSSPCPAR